MRAAHLARRDCRWLRLVCKRLLPCRLHRARGRIVGSEHYLTKPFTKDELLANVCLYWFTGAIGSSFWPYYARMHGPWPIPEGRTVDVPTGYCEFPAEILRPPRSLAARTYSDIRRWSVMPRGGHFAAMEQPEALAEEVRAFFRPLRAAV